MPKMQEVGWNVFFPSFILFLVLILLFFGDGVGW